MEDKKIRLSLAELYEQRTRLGERIDWLNHAISLYEAQLKDNVRAEDSSNFHSDNLKFNNGKSAVITSNEEEVNEEIDRKEIINVLRMVGRPLKRTEINNYLENNLGIYLPHTALVLKRLKNKNILASLKINNSKSLSYWVMSDWIDWDRQELKKEYKKFGVNKNFSIKTIEVY